jgi:hypothetical protein
MRWRLLRGDRVLRVPRHVVSFFLVWIIVVGALVPSSIVFGHMLIPDSWLMKIERMSVTSGRTHRVYFLRDVKVDFRAHWSVEVERRDPSGRYEGVCSGGSNINRPSIYTRQESPRKTFMINNFTGDADCNEKLGSEYAHHRMTACWYIPLWIWVKPICRSTTFIRTRSE